MQIINKNGTTEYRFFKGDYIVNTSTDEEGKVLYADRKTGNIKVSVKKTVYPVVNREAKEEITFEDKIWNAKDVAPTEKTLQRANDGSKTKKIKCIIEEESIELPKYETVCASGMDLRAWKYSYPTDLKTALDFDDNGLVLNSLERVLIKTGLHIELPKDIEAQIRPRSGLALKNGISIVNSPGTIDEDYRGDIGVVLINMSNQPFIIKKGDRIAQMVFQKVEKYDLSKVDKLSDTTRGHGGFNSTGVK